MSKLIQMHDRPIPVPDTYPDMFDKAPPLVQELLTSGLGFHLKGSRLIGGATASSDWDFVVENTEEVTGFLFDRGFRSLFDVKDVLTDCEYAEISGRWTSDIVQEEAEDGSMVQVTISKNPTAHLQAAFLIQNYLFEFHLHMPKDQRWRVWVPLLRALTAPNG